MLLAVYGTLMEGQGNWQWAIKRERIDRITLPGWEMYTNGGFPGSKRVEDQSKTIQVDLFEVTPEELSAIDRLEGYSPNRPATFYDRVIVDTPYGEAFIYEHMGQMSQHIPSGEWLTYRSEVRSLYW